MRAHPLAWLFCAAILFGGNRTAVSAPEPVPAQGSQIQQAVQQPLEQRVQPESPQTQGPANPPTVQHEIAPRTNRKRPPGIPRPKTPAPTTSATDRVKVIPPASALPLLKNIGFAAVPQGYRKKVGSIYRGYSASFLPALVTSDAVLHASHLWLSWYQRFLEMAFLAKDLEDLSNGLLAKTMEFSEACGEPWRAAAIRNAAFLTVGKRLLSGGGTSDLPDPWKGIVEKELGLITEAREFTQSPLFGYREDYSQYKPRGHYSRTEAFQRYFRAMTWFGRMTFRLPGPDNGNSVEQVLQAILLCRAIGEATCRAGPAQTVWKRIAVTTGLFAGPPDDHTPADYSTLAGQVFGSGFPASGTKGVDEFASRAASLPQPRILSGFAAVGSGGDEGWRRSHAGMRLFGTRFAIDSEILQKLTFDSVGKFTGQASEPFTLVIAGGIKVRGFPRGLDLLSALSIPGAGDRLAAGGDNLFEGYDAKMLSIRKTVPEGSSPLWRENLYGIRLLAIRELGENPAGTLPRAMNTPQWAGKTISAALGSWTELRHDSILYTKQSYSVSQSAFAGMRKGGPEAPPPPPPQGYVEPVPRVYSALAEAFKLLAKRIPELGYPPDKGLLEGIDSFRKTLERLEAVSLGELAGKPLEKDDFEFIERIGGSFEVPVYGIPHHSDITADFMSETDNDMPLVADVHTDPNSDEVLEEGLGYPLTLYMECPVNGVPTVCIGVAYSHFEFRHPRSGRLSDEEWLKMLDEGRKPAWPVWVSEYLAEP